MVRQEVKKLKPFKIQIKWAHNILKLMGNSKVVLGEKFIALSAFLQKLKSSHTNNLKVYLKALVRKEGHQKEVMAGYNQTQDCS